MRFKKAWRGFRVEELQAVAGLFPFPWRASSSRVWQPQQQAAHVTPLHKLYHPCLGSIYTSKVHLLNQYCQFLYSLHPSSRAHMRERERGSIQIRDLGSGAFLTHGSEIRNRFVPDPGSQTHTFYSCCWMRIRDPGWIKNKIRDPE